MSIGLNGNQPVTEMVDMISLPVRFPVAHKQVNGSACGE
ncbi:Hypothetical Protein RSKD131_4511 (plasmid) [Cereibacter sphaeroides KD131]|nr:Hypothetical Protein RSKD131_4511 [Cereibacter sphaeroides KD131]